MKYKVVQIWPGLICVYVCTNQCRSYLNHLVFTGHQFFTTDSFQEDCDSEVTSCSTKQVLSYSKKIIFFEHSIKKAPFSLGHGPCTKNNDLRIFLTWTVKWLINLPTVKKGDWTFYTNTTINVVISYSMTFFWTCKNLCFITAYKQITCRSKLSPFD